MGSTYSVDVLNDAFKGIQVYPDLVEYARTAESIISIAGSTSVGKSSLINYLTGYEISTVDESVTTYLPIVYQFDNSGKFHAYLSVPKLRLADVRSKIENELNINISEEYHNDETFLLALDMRKLPLSQLDVSKIKNLVSRVNNFNNKYCEKLESCSGIELIIIIGNNKYHPLFKLVDLPGLGKDFEAYHRKYYFQSRIIFFVTTPNDDKFEETYAYYLKHAQYSVPQCLIINKIDKNPSFKYTNNIIDKIKQIYLETVKKELEFKLSELKDHYGGKPIEIPLEFKYWHSILPYKNSNDLSQLDEYLDNLSYENLPRTVATINTLLLIYHFTHKDKKNYHHIENLITIDNIIKEPCHIYYTSLQGNRLGLDRISVFIDNKINCSAASSYAETMGKSILTIYRALYSTEKFDLETGKKVYFPEKIKEQVEKKIKTRRNIIFAVGGGFLVLTTILLALTGVGLLASVGLYGAAANGAFWAAIGGGSLAAGGFGMAGGMTIFGTVAAVTGLFGAGTIKSLLNRSVETHKLDKTNIDIILKNQCYFSRIKDDQEKLLYEGEFKLLKYNGNGTCYDADGNKFIDGKFRDGMIDETTVYFGKKKVADVWYHPNNDTLSGRYYIYGVLNDLVTTSIS